MYIFEFVPNFTNLYIWMKSLWMKFRDILYDIRKKVSISIQTFANHQHKNNRVKKYGYVILRRKDLDSKIALQSFSFE